MKKKAMTSSTNNPWINMQPSSYRRINPDIPFDIFYIKDHKGRYGISLKLHTLNTEDLIIDINIKKISVVINNISNNTNFVYLILTSSEEWQIFYTICNDLLTYAINCTNENELIASIKSRLKRWQRFLSQNNKIKIPLIKQMGLFTELIYLKDYVIPILGLDSALNSWGGPEFDKQDFTFEKLSVEIKSYISSKGPFVNISSLHQLDNTFKPLFLVAFGITISDKGVTIKYLIDYISKLFEINSYKLLDQFEDKLSMYGYISKISDNDLYKFSIDKILVYDVSIDFPKILRQDVHNLILNVQYKIDLLNCKKHETKIDILNNNNLW